MRCDLQKAQPAAAAEDDGWNEIGRGGVTAVVNRCDIMIVIVKLICSQRRIVELRARSLVMHTVVYNLRTSL